ncbi:MAG: preprotein translocase subunit SecE [Lentisphaeria bacterium]|jgi:preprotein translocase subunit SecE
MQNPVHTIRAFFLNVIAELKKCTWPTRQELVESTTTVILSVILLSLFVWLIDWLCQGGMRLMMKS